MSGLREWTYACAIGLCGSVGDADDDGLELAFPDFALLGFAASAALLLAGCEDQFDTVGSGRSLQPIPQKTLAQDGRARHDRLRARC